MPQHKQIKDWCPEKNTGHIFHKKKKIIVIGPMALKFKATDRLIVRFEETDVIENTNKYELRNCAIYRATAKQRK